jgi:hypothetical protein
MIFCRNKHGCPYWCCYLTGGCSQFAIFERASLEAKTQFCNYRGMGLEDHISGHDASCFRYLDTREPMGVVAKTEPSRNSFAHRLPWRVINFWGMPVCQGRIYEMWMRWLEVLCRGQFACGFLILPFADWINMRSIHHLQGEELRRPTLDFQDWSWMSMIYIYIQLYICQNYVKHIII